MLEFLKNQWFVGIGTGIISSIIVYFVTNWLYKRKDNSKHLEEIRSANLDIIRTIKPYVAEKGLPDKEIVDAIIVSTARKHNVKSDELYSIRVICEELIREIIENAYVSSDKKREYALQLKKYLQEMGTEQDKSLLVSEIEKEIRSIETIRASEYRSKTASMISAILALTTGVMTIILSAFSLFEEPFIQTSNNLEFTVVIAAVVCIFAILLSLVLSIMVEKMAKKGKKNTKSNQIKQ